MSKPPPFLLTTPEPIIKQRLYNGRKLVIWEGKIKVSSIQGWVENPRIELAKKKFSSLVGNRPLTQEDILNIMRKEEAVELSKLRDDILKNGLREPLTLSFDGTLLDGNRRFFAIKFALATIDPSYPNKQDLETVDAYVLSESATDDDKHYVLVEENFSASLKLEWPDYIKARRIVDAKADGLTIEEIRDKFKWGKGKIQETLKINGIIEEFMTFATSPRNLEDEEDGGLGLSEDDAERMAAENYQNFNEAQKSFHEPLKTDIRFKLQFFRWIYEGKFRSWSEVKIAYSAWKNPEVLAALMSPEPNAAKSAKSILDYNNRAVRNTAEASARINTFVEFLNDMSAKELKALPSSAREKLQEALQLVIKMSEAAASAEDK